MDRRKEIKAMLDAMEPEKREQAIAAMVRRLNARNKLIRAVLDPSPDDEKNFEQTAPEGRDA